MMIVVFDLDFTLVDCYATTVRPGMVDLLESLAADGHGLALWTAASRHRTDNIFSFHSLGRHFDPVVCRGDPLSEQAEGKKDIRLIDGAFQVDDEAEQIDYVRGLGLEGFVVSRFDGDPILDDNELVRLADMIAVANKGGD
jgi:hypothetical protein